MKKILVVEDDPVMNEGICYALCREQLEAVPALCLGEAYGCLEEEPDLILLDRNLPDGDGKEFLEAIRQDRSVPVIFLTARDRETEMLEGFDAGCDDYVVKPFSMPVLMKKIQVLLHRIPGQDGGAYRSAELCYDFKEKKLSRSGEEIHLTATEIRLLELFIANRGQVLTREQILEKVWDSFENYVEDRALNVNIRRMREKIEKDPKNPEYIKTVFGIGYKWQG